MLLRSVVVVFCRLLTALVALLDSSKGVYRWEGLSTTRGMLTLGLRTSGCPSAELTKHAAVG